MSDPDDDYISVRARVPQKQGLKLSGGAVGHQGASSVRARVPQKQGLKQADGGECISRSHVRARVPQKQGLKPVMPTLLRNATAVRARVPQKQGLKLRSAIKMEGGKKSPGASSTKTRIETTPRNHRISLYFLSGREFHKNKD